MINDARWLAGMPACGRERARAESVLCHLRSLFGDDLRAVPDLILRNLFNTAPWTYDWLTWLSESLVRPSSAANISSLHKRLVDPSQFMEAYSVLQVADRLHMVGLEISIDIPVVVGLVKKEPDLQVRDSETGELFFVEVSALFISAQQEAASAAFDQVSRRLLQTSGIVFAGQFLSLPTDDVSEIADRLTSELSEMQRCLSFREVTLPDVLELAIAPAEQRGIVQEWAVKRGLGLGSFAGPATKVNLGKRFAGKVADKVKQLPLQRPNLLVIPAQELFFCVGNPLELLPLLRESISCYPQVAAVVISRESLNHAEASVTTVDDDQLATSARLGLAQQFLLVSNRSATKPMDRSTRKKVWHAFAL